MPRQIAVSTWSVHRELGITHAQSPIDSSGRAEPTFGPGKLKLIDLPAELVRRGFARAEICHFHLASHDADYLATLKAAFKKAGVVIQTLLIDDGDVAHPEHRARDMAWIATWIDVAAALGAENARVIAGKGKPTAENLALSVDALRTLSQHGKKRGVRVVTENWFDLTASPRDVLHILDAVGPDLGFLADSGNWGGPTKYDDLAAIYARAELSHTKAHFGANLAIDGDDFRKCLEAAAKGNYTGPHTLIFEGDGDEWRGVDIERDFVRAHYASNTNQQPQRRTT
jgi:sugar phosphate isomerase/epimerase